MSRSRVTDDQLRSAAPSCRNLCQLLREIGLVACGGNYAIVRRRLDQLGLLDARFTDRVRPVEPRERFVLPPEGLAALVAGAVSAADVLRGLGVEPAPHHYQRLRTEIERAGLSSEHWRGRGWSRGTSRPRTTLEEVLVRGRPTSSGLLRRRLLREGLLDRCCSRCALADWQGQAIALELDHVNGDRDDNRLENLRLLCPNCHALTDTWRGRNVGRQSRTGA
jgi:5-methylcytosine-specific restriction endonuclease McrA